MSNVFFLMFFVVFFFQTFVTILQMAVVKKLFLTFTCKENSYTVEW